MHDFDAWKQKYHPGWYLNSLEEDENLFEDYMAWKRKENDHGISDTEQNYFDDGRWYVYVLLRMHVF